jgi:hypothetical protein
MNTSPADQAKSAMRWQLKASTLGRALQVVALLFFTGGAIYITRKNHIVVFGLVVIDLIVIGTQILNRSGVYELLIDDMRVEWGWAGVRQQDTTIFCQAVQSIEFFKRHDGTGSIQLSLGNGTCAILPSQFTDNPERCAQILAKLGEVLPNRPLTVS